ncbi:hypothetical protein [Agathobacter sp.]
MVLNSYLELTEIIGAGFDDFCSLDIIKKNTTGELAFSRLRVDW